MVCWRDRDLAHAQDGRISFDGVTLFINVSMLGSVSLSFLLIVFSNIDFLISWIELRPNKVT